jgi:ATP phosphoribosyltransferase
MVVKLALPNKGRLQEPAIRLLEDAGIGAVDKEQRQLFARTNDPELELVFVRAQDIPSLVAKGAADLGVTGYDLIRESGTDVAEVLDLGFGFARLVVAAHEKTGVKSARDIRAGVKVATEFPNLATKYFAKRRVKVELVRVSGAAEITPFVGVAELIVDLTSTGTTLRTHGLRIVDELFETSARLIANRKSLREKRAKIDEIKTALSSVICARGRKLVLMNVPEAKLAAIKRIVPGMAGPTVSRVEAKKPMLAVQVVVEANKVYEIVQKAKKAGAQDILVMPIERILP